MLLLNKEFNFLLENVIQIISTRGYPKDFLSHQLKQSFIKEPVDDSSIFDLFYVG